MPIPFVKGDPRINRKGRPKKGQALTDILSYKLDQKTGDGKLHREVVADKLIALAEAGDVSALKYLMDRIDGKPKESIEMSEKRDDLPADPEERRALAEQIEKELGLVRPGPANESGPGNTGK